MEISTAAEKLGCAKLLCNLEAEISVEGEWSIPEYLPEIFKIVKTKAEPVIVQKLAGGSRVTVDGYVRLNVLYQSAEDKRLYSVVQKLPFSKQFEMKESFGEHGAVLCDARVGFLNCRATNRRRLDARGAVEAVVRVLSQVPMDIVGDLSLDGVYTKTQEADYCVILADEEKQFTLDELLAIDYEGCENPALLRSDATAVVEAVTLENGRAALTGYVNVSTSFDISTAEEYRIKRSAFNLPFSQVLDLSLADLSACTAVADAEVISCAAEVAEEGNATCTVTCTLEVRVLEPQSSVLVTDAFSTKSELALRTASAAVNAAVFTVNEGFGVRFTAEKNAGRPIDFFISEGGVTIEKREGRDLLVGTATLCCLLRTDDAETDVAEHTFEYVVPLPKVLCGTPLHELGALFTSVECFDSETTWSAKCEGVITGVVFDNCPISVVCSMEEGGAKPQTRPGAALCVYYANAGESVWDIAREFNTSPGEIAVENSIEGERLEQSKPLLIPIVAAGGAN